jgi:hypothetical protein
LLTTIRYLVSGGLSQDSFDLVMYPEAEALEFLSLLAQMGAASPPAGVVSPEDGAAACGLLRRDR